MRFGDILAIVLSTEEDEPALGAAELIAEAHDARLSALLLTLTPDPGYAFDGFTVVGAAWGEPRGDVEKQGAELEKRLGRSLRPAAVRRLTSMHALAAERTSVEARYADMTVMTRPGGSANDPLRSAIFESVLFGSGRPVLLVPPAWRGDTIGKNVLIAWNATREATRALADAAPFLGSAESISVVTVDAKPEIDGHGAMPGAGIAAHLARLGLKVELRNVDGLGRDVEQALLDAGAAVGADLIVMGGYGHARLQEIVFGGVTRALVKSSPIPLFLSH